MRWRANFREWSEYNSVRCSQRLPWFTRGSYRKTGPWDEGTGVCGIADTLTDQTKNWEADAWAPGVVRAVQGGNAEAQWVEGNTANTLTVRNEWEGLLGQVTYELIAAPPEDPTWTLLGDVTGDNVSGDGSTSLDWDLE